MKITISSSSRLLRRSFTMGRKFVAFAGLFGCVAMPVQAGVWSEAPLVASPAAAADLSSGISTTKIYTHAVDWGSDDGGAVINGVTLVAAQRTAGDGVLADLVGSNFTLSGTTHTFQNNPANNYDPASGMFDMNDDFLFSGGAGVSPFQTLTLTGLTGGVEYIMSSYVSNGWNGGIEILSADDPGFTSITTDRGDAAGPKVIRYRYMLDPGDTDIVFTFDAADDANGFHQYGFTNERLIPEPAALGLLAVGTFGLLARRRRS